MENENIAGARATRFMVLRLELLRDDDDGSRSKERARGRAFHQICIQQDTPA